CFIDLGFLFVVLFLPRVSSLLLFFRFFLNTLFSLPSTSFSSILPYKYSFYFFLFIIFSFSNYPPHFKFYTPIQLSLFYNISKLHPHMTILYPSLSHFFCASVKKSRV